MSTRPVVVGEAPGILVVEKPPGLPTTSPDGRNCLVDRVRGLAPRSLVLHPSSRLDRDVTGIVVFATSDRAIRALLDARRRGRYRRLYVALVAPPPAEDALAWRWPIAIDPRRKTFRKALEPGEKGERMQDAETDATVAARTPYAALLHLVPRTGRTHQLRVHCARAGSPIVGDVEYDGVPRLVLPDGTVVSARRPLLHCARVQVPDERGTPHTFVAPLPADLRGAWEAQGGDPAALVVDPTPT